MDDLITRTLVTLRQEAEAERAMRPPEEKVLEFEAVIRARAVELGLLP